MMKHYNSGIFRWSVKIGVTSLHDMQLNSPLDKFIVDSERTGIELRFRKLISTRHSDHYEHVYMSGDIIITVIDFETEM